MTDATLAAGAAIWRHAADPGPGAAEVLLVHRPAYDDWSLPKGKSDADEHILLTAVREVWEETCVRPVLGPRLPTVEYLSWGRPKQVSYWSSFSGEPCASVTQGVSAGVIGPAGTAANHSRFAVVISSRVHIAAARATGLNPSAEASPQHTRS